MSQLLHFSRTLRSLPLWLLEEYLVELGGIQQDGGIVQGEGWTARLEQVNDFQIGSLRVGQVHLEVHAETNAAEALLPALEKKLLRAGG